MPRKKVEKKPDTEQMMDVREGIDRSKYTLDDRYAAAAAWMSTGSWDQTSLMTGIPEATVRDWARHAKWWPAVIADVSEKITQRLDAKLTAIVDKSTAMLIDRLDNGDYKVTRNGQTIRSPMTAKEITLTFAVTFDKLRILRNQPTKISGSSDQRITNLADKLRELGAQDASKEALEIAEAEIVETDEQSGS